MNEAIVYLSAIFFLITIFPVHVINYVFISEEKRYIGVNVSLYRLITVLNVNTDKPKKPDLEDNKDKRKKRKKLKSAASNWLTIYNNLCLTKVVQLGDYGIENERNIYVALAQNALTEALYAFIRINGGRTKLRNYAVMNFEHPYVNYYLKFSGVINAVTLIKLFTKIIIGNINERKNQKITKRQSV